MHVKPLKKHVRMSEHVYPHPPQTTTTTTLLYVFLIQPAGTNYREHDLSILVCTNRVRGVLHPVSDTDPSITRGKLSVMSMRPPLHRPTLSIQHESDLGRTDCSITSPYTHPSLPVLLRPNSGYLRRCFLRFASYFFSYKHLFFFCYRLSIPFLFFCLHP